MTTLSDLLNDLIKDAVKIPAGAREIQRMQLDDDMESISDITEDLEQELLEEYMDIIKRRLIGE